MENKSIGVNLFILLITLIYFVIELFINYILYQQMTVMGSYLSSLSLEFWVKIISGIGINVLIFKNILNFKYLKLMTILLFFLFGEAGIFFSLFCSLFFYFIIYTFSLIIEKYKNIFASIIIFSLTMPCSLFLGFLIQEKIAYTLINEANEETKNRAVLVQNYKNTIVTYYNNAEHIKNKDEYYKLLHPYYIKSSNINKNPNTLNNYKESIIERIIIKKDIKPSERVDYNQYINDYNFIKNLSNLCIIDNSYSNIEKMILPYKLLTSEIQSNKLKNDIETYYKCLINDKKYYQDFVPKNNPIEPILESMYWQYESQSEKYLNATRYNKSRANKVWREEMNKSLGFKTTLQPNLSYSDFIQHPDIKRYFKNNPNTKDYPYPNEKNFDIEYKKWLSKNILEIVLVGYDDKEVNYDYSKKEIRNNAYKAVIMPFIGMSISLFLVFLNMLEFLIIIIQAFYKRTLPLLSIKITSTALFIFTPFVFVSSEQANGLLKIIYFYQIIFIRAYEKFLPIIF